MQLENLIDVPLIVENGLNLVIKRSPLILSKRKLYVFGWKQNEVLFVF